MAARIAAAGRDIAGFDIDPDRAEAAGSRQVADDGATMIVSLFLIEAEGRADVERFHRQTRSAAPTSGSA